MSRPVLSSFPHPHLCFFLFGFYDASNHPNLNQCTTRNARHHAPMHTRSGFATPNKSRQHEIVIIRLTDRRRTHRRRTQTQTHDCYYYPRTTSLTHCYTPYHGSPLHIFVSSYSWLFIFYHVFRTPHFFFLLACFCFAFTCWFGLKVTSATPNTSHFFSSYPIPLFFTPLTFTIQHSHSPTSLFRVVYDYDKSPGFC